MVSRLLASRVRTARMLSSMWGLARRSAVGMSRMSTNWQVYDQPGGEWRRVQHAKGYHHIFVNGEETFADGESTGATPGRLLRHGRG